MRFTIAATLTAVLALGPLTVRADEPSAAMRVSDLAAELLSQRQGTCEDKEHGCPGCAEGKCDDCKQGHCEACQAHGCDGCDRDHEAR